MRIALTGAHSTGKSTLIAALATEEYLKGYTICPEITRGVKAMGLSINEMGSDLTQILVCNQHIANVTVYDNMLVDRCSLDGFIYSMYQFQHKRISEGTLMYSWIAFERTRLAYDYIFYIEPLVGMNIANDGVRSTEAEFRDGIVALYSAFFSRIMEFNFNLPENDAFWSKIHRIESAPVADRVMKIRGIINGN